MSYSKKLNYSKNYKVIKLLDLVYESWKDKLKILNPENEQNQVEIISEKNFENDFEIISKIYKCLNSSLVF